MVSSNHDIIFQFDFLIDIVPREEIHKTGTQEATQSSANQQTTQVVQTGNMQNNAAGQTIQVQAQAQNGSNGQVNVLKCRYVRIYIDFDL